MGSRGQGEKGSLTLRPRWPLLPSLLPSPPPKPRGSGLAGSGGSSHTSTNRRSGHIGRGAGLDLCGSQGPAGQALRWPLRGPGPHCPVGVLRPARQPVPPWTEGQAWTAHSQRPSPKPRAPCGRRAFAGVGEARAGSRVSEGEVHTAPEASPGPDREAGAHPGGPTGSCGDGVECCGVGLDGA